MPHSSISVVTGNFMVNKTRRLARERGVHRTACNLRKQGIPLAIALLLIVGRV